MTVIIIVLIVIMVIIISIPLVKAYQYHSEEIACQQAMNTAQDGLVIEYLYRQKGSRIEEARNTILEVMPGRDHICPTGGNVYLILNNVGIYEPVCGIHCTDKALRTRLNASYTLDQLKVKRRKLQNIRPVPLVSEDDTVDLNDTLLPDAPVNNGIENTEKAPEPDSIFITVNGKELECIHVVKEEKIHRGTDLTKGYKGIVAYYGVAGDFTFSEKTRYKGNGTVSEGDICYFLYADEDYCAIWRSNDGWDGDAYTSQAK